MNHWELVKDDRWHWHYEQKGTPVTTVNDDHLAVWVTPGCIRDHYGDEEHDVHRVTDAALEQAAYEFIDGDEPWEAFHRWCEQIAARAKEIDAGRPRRVPPTAEDIADAQADGLDSRYVKDHPEQFS